MTNQHLAADLIRIFDDLFAVEESTVLRGGAQEPWYQPATADQPAEIRFVHDYFASALHEIAHWCIAGRRRRALPDFGYWYRPDGRTPQQQAEFEGQESRPQAVEWLFHEAAGSRFHVSIDNLGGGGAADEARFRAAILGQATQLWTGSVPPRAWRFAQALADEYDGHARLAPARFADVPQ